MIRRAYNDSKTRWFTNRQYLAESHSSAPFDRVVLCNVLHEIDPDHWVDLFNSTSMIAECLSAAGFVLLIEDYLMPKGEYAHPFGFIVLETEPLQKLFGSRNGAEQIRVYSERDGRIKGHFIPKSLLSNVSADTVREALVFAQRHAKEQIQALRCKPASDFKAGKAHGFWFQQYANVTLALR